MIALEWGIPLLGCAFLPAFRSRRESWSEAGLVDRLEVDRPKELEIVLSLKNGWIDGAPRRIKSDMAIIPAGARHNIKNTGGGPLKLYTLYAPPEHVDGAVHVTKADAEASKAHFDGKTPE